MHDRKDNIGNASSIRMEGGQFRGLSWPRIPSRA
jgi:hypothetical protein